MMLLICPSCKQANGANAQFCVVCGVSLEASKPRKTVVDGGPNRPPAPANPGQKRRTMYAPGPAAPSDDPFARPAPRAAPDPADPFSRSVVQEPPRQVKPAPRPSAPERRASPRTAITPSAGGSSPTAPLRGVLVVYDGPQHSGELRPVYGGRNVIGRSDECDVCLEDGEISSQHAFLFVSEARINFMDVSRNGSLVDGRPIHGDQAILQHGSIMRLGGKVVVYLDVPSVSAEAWDAPR